MNVFELQIPVVGKSGWKLQLALKPFVAVLKQCNLMIDGVSVNRCTDGSRNGPYGARHAIVQSPLSCTICMRKECPQEQECRRSIVPAALVKPALPLLAAEGDNRS